MEFNKHNSAPRPDIPAMLKTVHERYGQSKTSQLYRDVERLASYWSEPLHRLVQRALKNLEAVRQSVPRLSDRIPPPDVFVGSIFIAMVLALTGQYIPIPFDIDLFTLHSIVAGTPGRGKTFFCRLILDLLAHLAPHLRIMVFDPNRSYARTCADPHLWATLTWNIARLGVFAPPPGYPIEQWITEKAEQFCRGELISSRYLFSRRLDALFEAARRRTSETTGLIYPSFHDLRDNLMYAKCRPGSVEERYRESLLNVVDGRIRTSGSIYDCSSGMESLLTKTRVRISTEGLAPIQSLEFFETHLIHYACRRRSLEPLVEPPTLHTLIVLEEAQTLLQKHGDNIAYYQELLLKARSLGIGFVFICQDISSIDPLVLAACSNFFVFGQSSFDDKKACQNLLDLSARETAMLSEISVGECFIRLSGHSEWPYPFLARIPDVPSA